MKYTTLGNCPFCDADMQNGISGGWGMSPEGWTQMKKKHDDVHPENPPVSPKAKDDWERIKKSKAMNIVNQLFDLALVPVEIRQQANDIADRFVNSILDDLLTQQKEKMEKELCEYPKLAEQDVRADERNRILSCLPEEGNKRERPTDPLLSTFYDLGWAVHRYAFLKNLEK